MTNKRRSRKTNTMAIVRATCPRCGDVEMGVSGVQVQLCVTTSTSTYSFTCPSCGVIVNKAANDAVVVSLTKAGSRLMAWSMPAELNEPKVGPRITYDDLLEFHWALESDAWRAELASLASNG